MSSAVHPITDIRRCYLPTANLAASRIFFKQLANRHDAHTAEIILFLQNCECCIIRLIDLVGAEWWGPFRFQRFSKSALYPTPAPPGSTSGLEPGIDRFGLSLGARVARVPAATACSSDASVIESVGDLLQRRGASLPNLSDDRQYVGCEAISHDLASLATHPAPWLLPAPPLYAARSACAPVQSPDLCVFAAHSDRSQVIVVSKVPIAESGCNSRNSALSQM
jgi:hypothetical protein